MTTMPTTPPLPTTHQNPTGTKTPFYNTPNIPLPLVLATTNYKYIYIYIYIYIATMPPTEKKPIEKPTKKPTNLHQSKPMSPLDPWYTDPPIQTHHLTHNSKPTTWPTTHIAHWSKHNPPRSPISVDPRQSKIQNPHRSPCRDHKPNPAMVQEKERCEMRERVRIKEGGALWERERERE